MTLYKMPNTTEQKKIREQLKKDTEEFLRNGGLIQEIPSTVRTIDIKNGVPLRQLIKDSHKRKYGKSED